MCRLHFGNLMDSTGMSMPTILNKKSSMFFFFFFAVFQYSSLHSVSEVPRDAYDNCVATNAIQSSRDGNTSIPLSAPGQKYFICGTMSHCLGGMRLQVSVNGNQASSPVGAPLAPESNDQVPTSLPRPTNNVNNPLPATPSAGFLFHARESLHVILFSVLGTILWMVMI